MNRLHHCTPLALALALAPAAASAQTLIVTRAPNTYVELTAPTQVFTTGADDSTQNVTLPFTYRFFDTDQTVVTLGVNGALAFPGGQSIGTVGPAPGTGTPNNFLAGFWDDLYVALANGQVGYQVDGVAPNRTITFEWRHLSACCSNNADLNFQIRLFEGPTQRIEIDYGPMSATASLGGTMGMENSTGSTFHNFALTTCSPNCALADLTAVSNSRVVIQVANDPELTASASGFPRGAFPGASAAGNVAIRNQGLQTARGVVVDLYLSTDATLDGADPLVGTTTATVPNGTTTVPATITVPAGLATADYYLFTVVDPDNDFPEANEADNITAAAQRFATGYELSATALVVLNAGGVNAGDTLNANLTVTHNGVPLVGSLEVALFASSDQLYDANDRSIGVATANLSGQNVETVQVSGVLPQLSPGPYYLVARLDPNNLLAESNESNNTFVGATPFSTGPDFTVGTITIPAEVTPGGSMAISTTINSVAVPFTGALDYRLFLSTNLTLEPTDTALSSYTVNFAGQPNRTDAQTVTFPGNLPAGRYYVIAQVDPNNRVVEVSETNNNGVSGAPTANAPDFGVSGVALTPATLEVGLTANLTATARSTGALFNGSVPYRVYLSADNVFDPGDQGLYNGTVLVPGLSTAAISASFPLRALPGEPQFNPGTYYAILVMDPDRATAEADEANNHAVAAATVTIRGADLLVRSITADPVVFIGQPTQVELVIENDDVADARNFRYAYYLSTNNIIRVTDRQIMLSQSATVAHGSSVTFHDTVQIPTYTSTQTLYLGVLLDIYSAVPESSESNNSKAVSHPIAVVFPIPNLRAEIIGTATAAAAGEQLAVTRLLLNDGVAEANTFGYSYYLSSNPQISSDDILLGSFQGSLPTGGDDYGIDTMTVPSGVQAGNYYVGLLLDPMDLVDEVDENDNATVGPVVPVFRAAIQFVTDTLPRGTVGVPYQVAISARGGAVPLSFAIQSGTLPRGLTLDSAGGILGGTPTEEGVFNFTLRASAGTAYADRNFELRIIAPTVNIQVATPSLPTGVVGRGYETPLVAVGGTLPYTWTAVSRLPVGLTLSESGVLTGRPETPGSLPVSVRVRDALGGTATKELVLNVINANAALQIIPRFLPEGIVGAPLCADGDPIVFEAQNGVPPYSWAIVGAAPDGMTLTNDTNQELGVFCGTPSRAGSFPMLVRVQDTTGLFDTSLFIFEVTDGTKLAVSTFSLKKATVGASYGPETLSAILGAAPYQWSVVAGWGSLPPGITVSADGVISGTPTAAGVYAFVVQVVDAQLRQDVQPLSIEVEEVVVVKNDDSGCSCSTSEPVHGRQRGLGLAALIGGLLLLRRRRSLLCLVGITGALLAPTSAQAQTPVPGTPYQISSGPISYADLPAPTVLSTDVDDGQNAIPLPFTVKFYDQDLDSVSMGNNGALAFPSGTTISLTNATPGQSATPNAFIAPFWDDQRLYAANMGSIGYQVQGTAPNRTITFEWRRLSRFGSTGLVMSFQVRFYEGPSGRIDIDYGPITGTASFSATMGMEDQAGARPISFASTACSPNCSQADFNGRSNTRVTVIQDPGVELVAQGITAPGLAFLGAMSTVPVQVQNLHGASIGPFTVSVVIGSDAQLSNPVTAGSLEISLSPFQAQTANVPVTPPASLGEGEFYYALVVDSAGVIPEVNELNNQRISETPTRLLQGRADLSVERVRVANTSLSAGDSTTVYTRIRNVGGEPANNVRVAVMLSSNPVISPQDLELGTFTTNVLPGQTVNATTTVTVPAATNSGTYYFGSYADSNAQIDELSESNNGRSTLSPIPIAGGDLAVLTNALPTAYRSVTYVALLSAVGGPGGYSWRVTQGNLPTGIGLVAATGELYGRPSRAESQNFTVEVTSGNQTATKSFTLTVSDPAAPLTIVTRAIPPAVVGQEYNFPLVVTGGAQSSTVTFTATGLPPGISVSTTGLLMGSPSAVGTSTITVTASADGETAQRDLVLAVRDNANLLITPRVLSTARFGAAYSEQLEATGGVPPITWLINLGNLPEGLSLSTSGAISGTPTQVGTFRFLVEARDAQSGGVAARDVNAFEIEVQDAEGFSISTTTLPDAILDQGYDQSIAAAGGEAPYTWRVTEGRVAPGLVTSANPTTNDFRIAGQPGEAGVFNFLLEVSDVNGRVTQRAFALRVLERAPAPLDSTDNDDGCSCRSEGRGGSAVSALLLLALLGVTRRRR